MRKYDIKVVALDIYGTVLCSDDADNCMPPRLGIEEFFDKCDKNGIKVCSCSDAEPTNVKIDLRASGVNPERFDNFFHLNQLPRKDFSLVVRHYGVEPKHVLVIGDNENKDIAGAVHAGCLYLHVVEYRGTRDDFDFRKIRI